MIGIQDEVNVIHIFVILVISDFGFESRNLVLIVIVSAHCSPFCFIRLEFVYQPEQPEAQCCNDRPFKVVIFFQVFV